MIHLMLAGGLGNQMFQYAYARALSERFGDHLIEVNPYFNQLYKLQVKLIRGSPEYLTCQLNLFALNSNVSELSGIKGWARAVCEIIPGSLIRYGLYKPKTTQSSYVRATSNGKFKMLDREFTYFECSDTCCKEDKLALGWFQNEKYFSNIRPILLKEFQFKLPPSESNQKMIDEISSCNSICVHIRRGDLANPHYYFLQMCNEDYYKQGMKYIAERIADPVFYIFTNNHQDVEWIKGNYGFDYPVKYVDLGNPGHEDMRLMYHCKHFIISKSSFSWWGSYMAQNAGKIVVAPEIQMVDSWLMDENYDGFYRDDMIKIPVRLGEDRI